MAKVLVVGGNSGIGLAAAELFQKHHHEVTRLSRANQFDFTNETVVRDFLKTNHFNYIVVTATTPLVFGSFKEIEISQARRYFEKYWGIVNVLHYAAKYSKNLEAITLISGAASHKRGAPITYLSMSCLAIDALTESLALELAPIRINAVSPGVTDTPLYGDMRGQLGEWVQADPLKRVATAEEIAQAIYFVSTHPNMTGAIVPCDGGSHLV